jgi:hypothetical protein
MAESEDYRDKADNRGYVTLKKDGDEAQVVPASAHVWVDRGWSVVNPAEKKTPTRKRAPAKTAEPKEG